MTEFEVDSHSNHAAAEPTLVVDHDVGEDAETYGESYFTAYHTGQGPINYDRSANWLIFFATLADEIVRIFRPATVLDAGCALGLLVESLWDRAVRAEGIDISQYAISHVRPDMRPHCRVASLTEPIAGSFDLVTCIEVLEHLTPADAEIAVANMCTVTDTILFSSTPTDFDEPTHINVSPPIAWIGLFAAHGFGPDFLIDGAVLPSHTMVFRRGNPCDVSFQTAYAVVTRYRILSSDRFEALAIERKTTETLRQAEQELRSELAHQAVLSAQMQATVSELEGRLEAQASLETELRASLQATLEAQLFAENQAALEAQRHAEASAHLEASNAAHQRADAHANIQTQLRAEALATLAAETKRYRANTRELQELIYDMRNSESWRITYPLRFAVKTLRGGADRITRRFSGAARAQK